MYKYALSSFHIPHSLFQVQLVQLVQLVQVPLLHARVGWIVAILKKREGLPVGRPSALVYEAVAGC
jgi:hypothetical protein